MQNKKSNFILKEFNRARKEKKKLLAILIDPEVFDSTSTLNFLQTIPKPATHIFVGGSTVTEGTTEAVITTIKKHTNLPVVVFPGDVSQISGKADALLFLSLVSGRNPEYLIEQHIKAIPALRNSELEVLPTGYLLLDGGNNSAVAIVTQTSPMSQENCQAVVDTAKACELLGMKLVYLEAGSGAISPVSATIISAVRNEINIPLLVGGGIRTESQKQAAYSAGADMVVMGTEFETRHTNK